MLQVYAESVNRMLTVDLDNSSAVRQMLANDWPDIRVHRFTKERGELQALKKIILKNFVLLSDLYVAVALNWKCKLMRCLCGAWGLRVMPVGGS